MSLFRKHCNTRRSEPWSSYSHNAAGRADDLIKPHLEYRRSGATAEERQAAYRQLFRTRIREQTLDEMLQVTHKAWGLGNDRFKRRIERQLSRRVEPRPRGVDRKSRKYREGSPVDRV